MIRPARFALCLLALSTCGTIVGGCSSTPVADIKRVIRAQGEPQLTSGIRLYDRGRYADATVSFQEALDSGLSDSEQVTANKYLAFISCKTGRERQCRAYFRRVLELNPHFELEPSEAGNVAWGPVFQSVKPRR